jgi:hypothetical protein
MTSVNGSLVKLPGESPPKREKAPSRALSPKDEKLTASTPASDLAQVGRNQAAEELVSKFVQAPLNDDYLLAFCIRVLNKARAELVGDGDMNLAFNILDAEREFLAAAIYRRPGAAERCWEAIRLAIARIRIRRVQRYSLKAPH